MRSTKSGVCSTDSVWEPAKNSVPSLAHSNSEYAVLVFVRSCLSLSKTMSLHRSTSRRRDRSLKSSLAVASISLKGRLMHLAETSDRRSSNSLAVVVGLSDCIDFMDMSASLPSQFSGVLILSAPLSPIRIPVNRICVRCRSVLFKTEHTRHCQTSSSNLYCCLQAHQGGRGRSQRISSRPTLDEEEVLQRGFAVTFAG